MYKIKIPILPANVQSTDIVIPRLRVKHTNDFERDKKLFCRYARRFLRKWRNQLDDFTVSAIEWAIKSLNTRD